MAASFAPELASPWNIW